MSRQDQEEAKRFIERMDPHAAGAAIGAIRVRHGIRALMWALSTVSLLSACAFLTKVLGTGIAPLWAHAAGVLLVVVLAAAGCVAALQCGRALAMCTAYFDWRSYRERWVAARDAINASSRD